MRISIVIPTYNRAPLLEACLDALLRQRFPRSEYEIIVVDDGSTDGTVAVLEQYKQRNGNILPVTQANQGPGAARNLGIGRARAPIIAFTDDDCLPDEDWLSRIDSNFQERPELAGVGGLTRTIPERITALSHWVEDELPYSFPSCNLACSREALDVVGGFDPRLYPNEDWDLTFALQAVGELWYDPRMVVVHPPRRTSFRRLVRQMRNWATDFLLQPKHPRADARSVQRSPWRVIYYHQLFVQAALRLWRFKGWIWRRPAQFGLLLGLLLAQRTYLILPFPHFLRIRRKWSRGTDLGATPKKGRP